MWWTVWLLVTVQAANHVYQYDDSERFSDDYDFYDAEEVPSSTARYITTVDALTRVRRYGLMDHQTHGQYNVRDVEDALNQLFSGRRMENSYTFKTDLSENRDNFVSIVPTRSKPRFEDAFDKLSNLENEDKIESRPDQSLDMKFGRRGWSPLIGDRSGRRQGNETSSISSSEMTASKPATTHKSTSASASSTTSSTTTTTASATTTTTASTTSTTASPTRTTAASSMTTTTASSNTTKTVSVAPTNASSTLEVLNTTSSTTTVRTRKTTTPRLDIEALLDIVANLTYDYDTNLTQVLNETLLKYSIPTCRTPTTTVTTTTVTTTEVFYNSTVISKCFVCGLDIPGIPRNTFCSDAFATDFLPLVPIDPTAKGHIASFRKYCRYFDVNNYQLNTTDPRAILGRWTGGCSVRWIDLSGVYTQRTCRNRLRPTTGLHFASKRMAKLELALSNVDNGCIISPMATLVPLSRGISLYARFHACVCTGNWCNRAMVIQRWPLHWFLFSVFVPLSRI